MQINTASLDQLRSFNDFARLYGTNSKAIARVDDTGALEGRTITAASTDSVRGLFKWFRSTGDKNANNSVRDLFMDTIAKLFGGESKIPADVKTKMLLKDFNKGKPLTARRIAKVSAAVLDALSKATGGITDQKGNKISVDSVKSVLDGKTFTPANRQITDDISNAKLDNLPPDIQKAFDDMQTEINERCGEGTVKNRTDVLYFIGGASLSNKLGGLAKGLVRDLKGADVTAAMRELLKTNRCFETHKTMERLQQIAQGIPGARVDRALVTSMFEGIPGLANAVKMCFTPQEYSETIDEFVPQMTQRLQISAAITACDKKSGDMLVEQFEKMTGIPVETLNPPLSLRTFSQVNVEALVKDINSGKVKVENADDVQKAFADLARNFVQERMELAKRVDGLQDVPDWVRNHLRQAALVAPSVKDFHLEGAALAKQLDLSGLKAALGAKPFKLDAAVQKMRDLIGKIVELGISTFGADKWSSMGVDGQQPFAIIMLKCALASDPRLIMALHTRSKEIMDGVSATITNAEAHLQSINTALYPAIQELGAAGVQAAKLNLPTTEYNATLYTDIRTMKFDKLPADVLKVIDDMKDAINARCGEGTVKSREETMVFVRVGSLTDALDVFSRGLTRNLTADDFKKVCSGYMKTKNVVEVDMLHKRIALIGKRIENAETDRGLAVTIMGRIPGLRDELKACKTSADFKATLDKFEPQIEKRMRIAVQVREVSKKAPDMLVEEYAKATGLDKGKLNFLLDLKYYKTNVVAGLLGNINKDKVKVESEQDIENAFRNLAKNYVAEHLELAKGVDSIENIPDKAREHLRLSALTTPNVENFTFDFVKFAGRINLAPLKAAVTANPFKLENAFKELRDLCRNVHLLGVQAYGGIGKWFKLGADFKQPCVAVMFKCALANDMELLAALNNHVDELMEMQISGDEQDLSPILAGCFDAVQQLFPAMQ